MVCAYCGGETSVVNSRPQKRNNQVWRRRHCLICKAVFTTHESIDLTAAFSVATDAGTVPFNPYKLFEEIRLSLRDHQKPYEAAQELTTAITQRVLKKAPNGLISPHSISFEAAKLLKRFDKQAYLRYIAEHPSLQ
jgi:transcriptional repressor NrdR